MKRKLRALLLIAYIALMLTGCAQSGSDAPSLPKSSATPPPVNEETEWSVNARLYFRSGDGTQLSDEERMVKVAPGKSVAWASLLALCDGPATTSLGKQDVIPSSLVLNRVDLVGNVCHVYFEGRLQMDTGKTQLDEQTEFLVMRAAIAKTVMANQKSIQYIDVFVNGIQVGFLNRPLGLLSEVETSLEAYVANIRQEAKSDSEEEIASLAETKQVQYFFPDTESGLMHGKVYSLTYKRGISNEQALIHLLEKYSEIEFQTEESRGISDLHLSKALILPARAYMPFEQRDEEWEKANALMSQTSPYIIELYYEKPDFAYDAQLTYGSIVYTVTGFCPKALGLRLIIDGELQNPRQLLNGGGTSEDLFRRSDFDDLLGQRVEVFLPEDNGRSLYHKRVSMPAGMVYDTKKRAEAIVKAQKEAGFGFISEDDILSAVRRNNMVVINFKEGFYQKFTNYVEREGEKLPKDARARMFVFSLVNSLCSFHDVGCTWILENGRRIDEQVDHIYLGNAIFYNPGLDLNANQP